jgi:hypothetical protein
MTILDPMTAPVPSQLPDVHRQSFGALLTEAGIAPESRSKSASAAPLRLQKAIERVARESSESAGPGGISAFNSSI